MKNVTVDPARQWHQVLRVLTVGCAVAGVGFLFPALGVAQGLPAHDAKMTSEHNALQSDHAMIKSDVGMVKTDVGMIKTDVNMVKDQLTALQAAVDNLQPGAPAPPCGAGTGRLRFVTSTGNPEVCDNTTGLFWEKAPDATSRIHADAVTHCAGLALGNGQTYRLPDEKELISLVDYTRISPALPFGHPFSNIQTARYWSATTYVGTPGDADAWFVDFGHGLTSPGFRALVGFVWCVRDGA
jgi:hypothetical protein